VVIELLKAGGLWPAVIWLKGAKMSKKYIHWKSKITGYSGGGTLALPVNQAEEVVARLNSEHPQLTHWATPTPYNKSLPG